jgi:hypothetical protein
VNVEKPDQKSSESLRGKIFFGERILVAIDSKVLSGTLDDKQRGNLQRKMLYHSHCNLYLVKSSKVMIACRQILSFGDEFHGNAD